MTAPDRALPASRRPHRDDTRPHLRLVPRSQDRARARARAALVLATAFVFVVLLVAAVVHTTIVSGQRELDRLDARITETERRNQGLDLRVAEMASPERIVEAATEDGMVVPEDVTWLSPVPAEGGGSASGRSRSDDTGSDPAGEGDDQRAATDGTTPAGSSR